MPRAWLVLRASRDPNRRVFRRSQILALWNGFLLIYRLGSSLRPPLALALRNSAALTSTLSSTVALLIPAGLHGPRPDGSVPASSRRTAQPFDFSEISLFPLRASASRAAFQGIALQTAHALCARNSFKYIAQTTSVQAFPALPPGALIHAPRPGSARNAQVSTRNVLGSATKPLGHLPSPEDGPRTPTGQSLASENAPFGAVRRVAPRYSRSLITAGRSPLCSAYGARLEHPSIEQSAFQTCLAAKSL